MTQPANILEDIREIFSILHDGTTSTYVGDKNLLTLEVECQYLAELIDKSYKSFYIECGEIEKIELHPWMNTIDVRETFLTNIEDIFKADLEILSADIENNAVKITCNQDNTDFDYCSGALLLACKTIKIFDQARLQLTIEELGELCKSYWNPFDK